MKKGFTILAGILLAAALSSPALAGDKGRGDEDGESLEDRVAADEALIATLQSQVAVLQSQVATLQGDVADLQGQNSWAVVTAGGTVVRAKNGSDLIHPVTVEHSLASGVYDVTFSTDVSGCAYTATIGGTGHGARGFVSVLADVNADSKGDVTVSTFDKRGKAADSPFHLYVSCD